MDSTFFAGTSRRVTVGAPSLLGGKGKARKIRLPLVFPLSGESFVAMPLWLSEACDAVSKFASDMTPSVEQIADIALILENPVPIQPANGVLFEAEPAKVPSAELRSFSVIRMGEAENPDVCLSAVLYTDFSRHFWKWLGEYAHSEVVVQFQSSKAGMVEVGPPAEQVTLDKAVNNAEHNAFVNAGINTMIREEGPGSEQFEQEVREALGAPEPLSEAPRLVRHDDPDPKANGKGKKSGPAELKEFHAKETTAGRIN